MKSMQDPSNRDVRELAVKAGDDLADSLGGAGGGGDDVAVNTTATTPVFVRGTVNGLLGSGGGVDGGHQGLDDTELVVDDLGERCQAVGRAGGVGDLATYDALVTSTSSRYERTERTTVSLGSYSVWLTPTTNMGASAEGAEMMTFLAPPFKWREALGTKSRHQRMIG